MGTLENLRIAAKRWLKLLRANDADARHRLEQVYPDAPTNPTLRDVQHALAAEHGYDSWRSLRDTPRPDRERYASLARDILAVHDTRDSEALKRLRGHYGPSFMVEQFLKAINRRLNAIAATERPDGPFGLPHAQLLIAKESGFNSWNALIKELDSPQVSARIESANSVRSVALDITEPMVLPVEMRALLPVRLQGQPTTTHDVWRMLSACRAGDVELVTELIEECPVLTLCDYNYMAPLHLAVREGHANLVRLLIEKGAPIRST